jgi:CubicO group peptidase (beta-lactamase class C family)
MSSSTANSEYSEFEATCNISMMMQDALDTFPSIAVGAVVNGSVVYMNASGVTDTKNLQTSDPIAADINSTAYEIASISKTFLAILSLQCQERHIIDIQNDDINKFLSKRNIHISNPYFPKKMISIYHLLTHGSGLCDDESALSEGSPWRTNDMDYPHPLEYYVINRIAQTTSIWSRINAPGRHYHYSNAGFTLLAFVLECASDMSLCDMLKEWILPTGDEPHFIYAI